MVSYEAMFGIMFMFILCLSGLVVWLMIEVKSMQRSTHQVQFVPVDDHPKAEEQPLENIVDKITDFENII